MNGVWWFQWKLVRRKEIISTFSMHTTAEMKPTDARELAWKTVFSQFYLLLPLGLFSAEFLRKYVGALIRARLLNLYFPALSSMPVGWYSFSSAIIAMYDIDFGGIVIVYPRDLKEFVLGSGNDHITLNLCNNSSATVFVARHLHIYSIDWIAKNIKALLTLVDYRQNRCWGSEHVWT